MIPSLYQTYPLLRENPDETDIRLLFSIVNDYNWHQSNVIVEYTHKEPYTEKELTSKEIVHNIILCTISRPFPAQRGLGDQTIIDR